MAKIKIPNINRTYLLVCFVLYAIGIALIILLLGSVNASILYSAVFISFALIIYLYRQEVKADEEREDNYLNVLIKDAEDENWVNNYLVTTTLPLLRSKKRKVILIGFGCVLLFAFFWSYSSFGLTYAVKNSLYALLFFSGYAAYILFGRQVQDILYDKINNSKFKIVFEIFDILPRYQLPIIIEWIKGYFLFLPIVILGYIFITDSKTVGTTATPGLFLLSYTISYISLYLIVYFYKGYQKEEADRLEEKISDELKFAQPENKHSENNQSELKTSSP